MTKAETPKPHHHGNLRAALIEHACAAAQTGTLDSLSIRHASRQIGVSPGAAYRHFADRDDLLRAVADRGFDQLAESFARAVPFDSVPADASRARAAFVELAGCYVDFARDHYGLWRLMFGPHGLRPSSAPATRPSTYAWLGKALADLAAHRVIRPPSDADRFFAWSAIHGLADLQASPAIATAPPGQATRAQCEAIIASLRAA